ALQFGDPVRSSGHLVRRPVDRDLDAVVRLVLVRVVATALPGMSLPGMNRGVVGCPFLNVAHLRFSFFPALVWWAGPRWLLVRPANAGGAPISASCPWAGRGHRRNCPCPGSGRCGGGSPTRCGCAGRSTCRHLPLLSECDAWTLACCSPPA